MASMAYLPTLPVFLGVSKFYIKSCGLPVRAPNLPGNTYRGLFQKFFINFTILQNVTKENKTRSGFSALTAVLGWKT